MDKQYFIKLLQKYNEGKATKEEQQFLINYYNLFQSEAEISALFSQEEKDELKHSIKLSISKENLRAEKNRAKVRSIGRLARIGAAAAVILIACVGTFLYLKQNNKTAPVHIAENFRKKENRFVRLPDGSTVIVDTGSKLNYPSSFDGLAAREVYLEGQAFFDIKHDASKPFIVHTGKLSTTVLGTAFNIKALPQEENITVTVIRGKVKVSNPYKTLGLITPNEEIVYNKKDDRAVQATVDSKTNLGWKEQDLLFDDVTMAEASELFEKQFNVSIIFSDSLIRNNRFTATFQKDEKLEQVLKSICEFNNAVYQYDARKNTVVISSVSK